MLKCLLALRLPRIAVLFFELHRELVWVILTHRSGIRGNSPARRPLSRRSPAHAKQGAIEARFMTARAGGAETGCFGGVNLRCKRATGSRLAATAALSGS